MAQPTDVLIIGAGLAGLSCARHLHRAGVACTILDASDEVGGRVRTDEADGYLFDRGFQVLLTAYPEAQRQLDYRALDLRSFYSGALIRFDGRFHRLADPFRHLLDAAETIISPIGTFKDKLRVAKLRTELVSLEPNAVYARDDLTTEEALRDRYRFSENIIDRFFRPFFGGIFLDASLQTSSRLFDFIFRMFSLGDTALPARGMQAIPRHLAADLPDTAVRLNTLVASIDDGAVTLATGDVLEGHAVVVATDAPAAGKLIDLAASHPPHSTVCLYYSAAEPPLKDPVLVLNGDGEGPINNVNLLSNVSATYAPEHRALISVAVLGDPDVSDDQLEAKVRRQLAEWFGPEVGTWAHLRTYRVRNALPDQRPPLPPPAERPVRQADGLYVCGDYRATASIDGALRSGRLTAEAILTDRA